MSDSVTENFFGKLRHLAAKLEKETKQLEYEFNREDPDSDDNEDSPMTVLHELNTEIRNLKREVQVSIDGARSKEQGLVEFIKACKLLKQKTKSDLEQIRDVFEKYGYKPPEAKHSEQGMNDLQVNLDGDNADYPSDKEHTEDMTIKPGLEKGPAAGDFLQLPKLSDFGLSQYQFRATWGPRGDKPLKTKGVQMNESKTRTARKKESSSAPKDMSDILVLSKPKTPKWASRDDDDSYSPRFQQYGVNDDYTMALFNMKVPAKSSVPQKNGNEGKMTGVPETLITGGSTCSASPIHLPDGNEDICSPSPPTFLTPGLKTAKQQHGEVFASSTVEEPVGSPDTETPPLPQFETQWLRKLAVNYSSSIYSGYTSRAYPYDQKSCSTATAVLGVQPDDNERKNELGYPVDRCYNNRPALLAAGAVTVPIYAKLENQGSMKQEVSERDNLSTTVQQEEAQKSALMFCHKFSENTVKLPTPPKITDFDDFLLTPQRPVLTSLMNDFQVFKPSYF